MKLKVSSVETENILVSYGPAFSAKKRLDDSLQKIHHQRVTISISFGYWLSYFASWIGPDELIYVVVSTRRRDKSHLSRIRSDYSISTETLSNSDYGPMGPIGNRCECRVCSDWWEWWVVGVYRRHSPLDGIWKHSLRDWKDARTPPQSFDWWDGFMGSQTHLPPKI